MSLKSTGLNACRFGLLVWLLGLTSGLQLCAAEIERVEVVRPSQLADARQPQAAVNNQGHIFIAFGSKNAVYCAASTDRGTTYGEPVLVGQVKNLSLGMRRGPRIAVGGGSIVVTAIGGDLGGGKDGDLLAWRSKDGGRTWSKPVRVNDVPAAAREGLHAMTAGPYGFVYCVWLDLRERGTRIFGSASVDGGATWSENRLVYRSPSGSVCECCHPSIAMGPDGQLHVMWRNSLDGERDIYMVSSSDTGKTFSDAKKLGSGSWPLDACPMDGGAIAVAPDGQVMTVWRREKQLYLSSGDNEELLARGEQPWIASGDETYVVWISKRPGELWLRDGHNAPEKIANNAADPVVAASPGKSGPVVVCWEQRNGDRSTILAATLGR